MFLNKSSITTRLKCMKLVLLTSIILLYLHFCFYFILFYFFFCIAGLFWRSWRFEICITTKCKTEPTVWKNTKNCVFEVWLSISSKFTHVILKCYKNCVFKVWLTEYPQLTNVVISIVINAKRCFLIIIILIVRFFWLTVNVLQQFWHRDKLYPN